MIHFDRPSPSIALLTLKRPATRNALSNDMIALLIDLLSQAAAPPTRVIIITGAGDTFSSGGSFTEREKNEGMLKGIPLETRDEYVAFTQRLMQLIWSLDLPIIAALNGPAIGIGADIALYSDIRVASPSATLAESFIQLGIIPGGGGAWILPRLIGLSRAFEMILTGETVDAEKALKMGLISHIYSDNLLAHAIALAEQIAAHSLPALRMTKLLMKKSLMADMDTSLQLAAAIQALLHTTEEHQEAVEEMVKKLKHN